MRGKQIKIAYIGGGSRGWARTFMFDLALQDSFCGTVSLYDIDKNAVQCNKIIGDRLLGEAKAVSKWNYEVAADLGAALKGADFVMISILPGTFDEMQSDVHAPEEFGVYQTVGDTAGPGGILRAMRTVPVYEEFAAAIEKHCPDAFVINLTNPMAYCTAALYDIFPKIKAFGCCHEVFGTQKFLADAIMEVLGVKGVRRQDIKTDVAGVNHFTWFTKATYQGSDIFPLYKQYVEKHISDVSTKDLVKNPFESANLVKMDLFRRFNQIAAAGDRHLVEFLNSAWYLKNPETAMRRGFGLTSVKWRRADLDFRIKATKELVDGGPIEIVKSDEEFVILMEGLLGLKDFVSNVNLPNSGQAPFAPIGTIVETNASFTKGKVTPLTPAPLLPQVETLVSRAVRQQRDIFSAVRKRNLNDTFSAFMNEPLCSALNFSQGEELFGKMVENTKRYLPDWKI